MAKSYFAQKIIQWHEDNPRQLPWTGGVRDPYSIWISEIIMQQTRIEQGSAYYLRFINTYPTVTALARASVNDVMMLWQGLGYYTRARNIHKAAQYIVNDLDNQFPSDYASLLNLPGIGPYSAAAIASFAYGHPHAVVDGNVKRVMARFYGIVDAVDTPAVHERIRLLAQHDIQETDPAAFNQAIMNFGALICKPKPLCEICPLHQKCYALRHDMTEILPVRIKKKESKTRIFHFVVMHYKNKILLQHRAHQDIWKGLYAPPLIETNSPRTPGTLKTRTLVKEVTGHDQFMKISSSSVYTQKLTHQIIMARFHHVALEAPPVYSGDGVIWVNHKTVHEIGKPRMIVQLLDEMFATRSVREISAR